MGRVSAPALERFFAGGVAGADDEDPEPFSGPVTEDTRLR